MKQYKKILSLLTAASLAAAFPIQAMAENPEFAHDEATWARLRDNIMEYDELNMLVEEYNPSYMNRQVSYRDTKDERDKEDVRQNLLENASDMDDQADSFRDQAESLLDLADSLKGYPPSVADSILGGMGINSISSLMSSYAAVTSAAAMMENKAMSQRISADKSYEDAEMRKLQYMKDQTGLIVSTQSLFDSYNQLKNSMGVIQKNIEIMDSVSRSTETKASIGMATQVDILTAKKNVQSLQSNYIQSQSSLNSIKQNLCLMTGWQYNAEPEIREVPTSDLNRILLMNPDADKEKALNNNYDLRYNKRAYDNMDQNSTDRKNMERTIKNQEETIVATVKNLYNDVLQKKTALELAEAELATETKAMSATEQKHQLGMVSSLEYLQEQAAFSGKQLDRDRADIDLFQAMETYDWALNGYMTMGN